MPSTIYRSWKCSPDQQDQERRIRLFKYEERESIFGDHITGVSNYGERPEYSKMVEQLKPFDCVHTEDLTRYGRSMVQMLVEINKLIERDIHVITEVT